MRLERNSDVLLGVRDPSRAVLRRGPGRRLLAATGTLAGSFRCGVQWLLWGVVYRTIYTWHVTWGVNSAAHLWGYRNYETRENSRNNWLIALGTNGEGWHNNHHADPRAAAHGHRWWELDVTYVTICLWEKLGLAWDVLRPINASLTAASCQ